MDTKKNTIAFKINVDTVESCGKLANFIYKRENHLDMEHEEIDIVRYKYYMKEAYSNRTSAKWVRTIYKDTEFANVKEPENIKKITSVFDVVYCIVIGQMMDICYLYINFLFDVFIRN